MNDVERNRSAGHPHFLPAEMTFFEEGESLPPDVSLPRRKAQSRTLAAVIAATVIVGALYVVLSRKGTGTGTPPHPPRQEAVSEAFRFNPPARMPLVAVKPQAPEPSPRLSAQSPHRHPREALPPPPLPTLPPLETSPGLPEDMNPTDRASAMLTTAFTQLWRDRNPEGALKTVAALPPTARTQFTFEIERLTIAALMALHREDAALDRLAALPAGSVHPEFLILRGELLAKTGACKAAVRDFNAARALVPSRELTERTQFAHASCLLLSGSTKDAREVLADYLERFPDGRHVDAVRHAFSETQP